MLTSQRTKSEPWPFRFRCCSAPTPLEYRLGNSGTKVVITDPDRLGTLREIRENLPGLERLVVCGEDHSEISFWKAVESASDTLKPIETDSEDPAILVYTSGTTGPPKGALHAHRTLIGHLSGFELSHNFFPRDGDCFWTPADWAWAGGLLDALLPSWYYGVPVLAYEGGKFDPEKAFHLLQKYGIRNAFIPPTALKMMRQVPKIKERFAIRLRSIMSAGEAVGEELLHWGREHLNVTINEMWGQTEANYLVGNCNEIMDVRPGSIGKPYPGHHVEVIDEQGNPAPQGESGEFACKAGDPIMFLGYWGQPEATEAKFNNGRFTTGDVGFQDDEGYLWFTGRKDDVISSAGYRIGPTEIEDCLLKHPAVVQAAVIGVPDDLRGNIIKAFIVPAEGYETSESLAGEIRNHVRGRLAAYEYPREIEFITELPLTTSGKVRRMELRRREAERVKGKSVSD